MAKYSRESIPSLEEKTRKLSFENEDLKRKIAEQGEIIRGNEEILTKFKISVQENEQYARHLQEYEHRMSQISSEVERLNNAMRSKVEELNEAHNKIRHLGS